VARWTIQLQEFDLEIKHVKGIQNHLADVLSRNPTGLSEREVRNISNPDEIMVNKVNIYEDRGLQKELQALSTLQDTDTRLRELKQRVCTNPSKATVYMIRENVLYCKKGRHEKDWKPMLPSCLEQRIFKYVHCTMGHMGVDKCMHEIKYVFHVKNLGRKIRKFIACCNTCQRNKHPNKSVTIEEKHHLPKAPGDLCALDIYGSLPTSRGGVKFILVCLDVFSRFIKLYPLKSNTTRACRNKLLNDYFVNVIRPKAILSDNATQFRSPQWIKPLQQKGVEIRFSPIRHPESNPCERYMREIGKFCRTYCHQNHKKWAELTPHIERWINNSVCSSTNFCPVELMYRTQRPSIFKKILEQQGWQTKEEDSNTQKIEKAYVRMKTKALERERRRRKGNTEWSPQLGEKVLVRTQPVSDAIRGITAKFAPIYEGPYVISKILEHGAYELQGDEERIRGEFSKKQLRQYREESKEGAENDQQT
jgi:hypothetical protein